MSGICGVVTFDGRPVTRRDLERLTSPVPHRGPDGVGYWTGEDVGMAHLAMNTTPESLREHQPLASPDGLLHLTADARVDNRAELALELSRRGHLAVERPTDADLILAAYRRWGTDCPLHLLGDFAFALWDSSSRLLVCACDWAGSRPLYYRHSPAEGRFSWGSEIAQLVPPKFRPDDLDEEHMARDLTRPGRSTSDSTYFKAVKRLRGGETLVLRDGRVRTSMYFTLGLTGTLHHASDDDYAAHFRSVFEAAVSSRLRSNDGAGVFLSGGLDSAAIVGAARGIATQGAAVGNPSNAGRLVAAHFIYPQEPKADERSFARAVAAAHPMVDYREIDTSPFWQSLGTGIAVPSIDEPYASHMAAYFVGALGSLRTDGGPRVWMTGHPGDNVVGGNNPFYYLSSLLGGRIPSLLRDISHGSSLYGISRLDLVHRFMIDPLLLTPARRMAARHRAGDDIGLPKWLGPRLRNRVDLGVWARAQTPYDWVSHPCHALPPERRAKEWRHRVVAATESTRLRTWFERTFAHAGVEVRNPWDDLRLVRLALAFPETQLCRGIDHKLILRRAISDDLPKPVRERRGMRVGPGPAYLSDLRRYTVPVVRVRLRESRAAELGYLDAAALAHELDLFARGRSGWSMGLATAIAAETWLSHYLT